jgi:hypothetical protein
MTRRNTEGDRQRERERREQQSGEFTLPSEATALRFK